MRLQLIVILLVAVGITTGLAQLGENFVDIAVTSEGKVKISQTIFPETFVATMDVPIISEKISKLLATDEQNTLLGTTQNENILKIATLGASTVDLKYEADVLTYESGVFRLNYDSGVESKVSLPPLSKLVSLNTIPISISENEYVLPPGDISLSFSIRPVTSKEFFVSADNSEYKVEAITAAKIEEFSANSDEIQFIMKDRTIVLTIIPKQVMENPNDALLNGEDVDFSLFHQNATHSWVRIDPHEKGLVRILDTNEKPEDGGCLIATAAFGSELAPQVQFLREIRDNQLMNTASGVSFMTGFNQLYYSFSPAIADLERENPIFKEIVKIGITPLLASLSIMTFAESEHEVLGFGIGVILLNIGMYLVLPILLGYHVKKNIRTTGTNRANQPVISNCHVNSAVKTNLFGVIALFVLAVSVSSAFLTPAYAAEADAIQTILEITYENIQESFADAELDPLTDPVFLAAQEDYFEALEALDAGDLVAAEANALSAMDLFEISAGNIGEMLEAQQATIQPLGLSTAVSSIFSVQEEITDSDSDVNDLRELVKINNFDDVDFSEYDESVNLAKTLLADGYVPDAQAQLALANEIKDSLYQQVQDATNENSAEEIEDYLEDHTNLGLTLKDIRELETILDDITSEEDAAPGNSGDAPGQNNEEGPGNSENAPGQNKENSPGNSGDAPGQNNEEGPGNSENAPGQNKDSDEGESPEGLPPGFNSALETGQANGQGNGLGLGKIPPGWINFVSSDSPDDYFENHYESDIDDSFEDTFDGTQKGNGDGKGKYKAHPSKAKSGAPGSFNADIKSGGKKPFCAGKATGGIPIILLEGDAIMQIASLAPYVEPGYRACAPGTTELTDDVVVGGDTVDPNTDGLYVITYDVTNPNPPGNSANQVTRTVLVGNNDAPVKANDIPDQNVSSNPPDFVFDLTTDPTFTDAQEASSALTYTITGNTFSGQFQSISITGTVLTIDYRNGPTGTGTGDITITATDLFGETATETFSVTVS